MTGQFFEKLAALDQAIDAGPSACEFDRDIAPFIEDAVARDYFLSRLVDVEWVDILSDAGMFSEPPGRQMVKSEDSVGYRFPTWEASRFLIRVAPEASNRVLEVMSKIPVSNNYSIHEDLVDAACVLPAAEVKEWVENEVQWLRPSVPIRVRQNSEECERASWSGFDVRKRGFGGRFG